MLLTKHRNQKVTKKVINWYKTHMDLPASSIQLGTSLVNKFPVKYPRVTIKK